MKERGERDLSLITILLIGFFITGLGLIESLKGWPYAPFPIVHASLALIVPLRYGSVRLGNPFTELRQHLWLLLVLAIALVLYISGFTLVYGLILKVFGRIGDPSWDLIAEYKILGKLYVARHGWTATLGFGYLLVGIWPMFGEEFFYRGLLFGGLKHHVSSGTALIISASLFGLRHSFQLVYLWPSYPLVSGVCYFLWAFGFALIWTWAYHRSECLWLCIITHAANLVLALLVFALLSS